MYKLKLILPKKISNRFSINNFTSLFGFLDGMIIKQVEKTVKSKYNSLGIYLVSKINKANKKIEAAEKEKMRLSLETKQRELKYEEKLARERSQDLKKFQ